MEGQAQRSDATGRHGEGVVGHLSQGEGRQVLLVRLIITEDPLVIVVHIVDAIARATYHEQAGRRSLLEEIGPRLTLIIGKHDMVPPAESGRLEVFALCRERVARATRSYGKQFVSLRISAIGTCSHQFIPHIAAVIPVLIVSNEDGSVSAPVLIVYLIHAVILRIDDHRKGEHRAVGQREGSRICTIGHILLYGHLRKIRCRAINEVTSHRSAIQPSEVSCKVNLITRLCHDGHLGGEVISEVTISIVRTVGHGHGNDVLAEQFRCHRHGVALGLASVAIGMSRLTLLERSSADATIAHSVCHAMCPVPLEELILSISAVIVKVMFPAGIVEILQESLP